MSGSLVEHLFSQEVNLIRNIQPVCPVFDLVRPEEIEFFQQFGRLIAHVLATCRTATAGEHVQQPLSPLSRACTKQSHDVGYEVESAEQDRPH